MIDIPTIEDTAQAVAPTRRRRRRRRGDGKMAVGAAVVGLFVLAAVLAPLITSGHPGDQDLLNRLAHPSHAHLLGTDQLGRDEWTRLVYAIRIDLRVAVLGSLIPAVLGSLIGIVAGLGGNWLDTAIMRTSDVVVSLPLFIFFIALVGLLGPGTGFLFLGPGELPLIIGFTVISWVVYARLLRSEVRRVRSMDFVRAARLGGLPRWRVIAGHVVPNAIGQSIVYFFVDVGLAVVAISTLSFLGVGIPIGTPEWGSMIQSGRGVIQTNWWLIAAPGVAIALIGMGLALIGDGLDDRIKS
ncbi:ABC transporter permease [Streptomyces sp. NBC_01239]|uniref:ABC transporter permease n=1 Tax=Streptomyces sp. NBC_01239 TaxID=2903792 RepID=UPI00224EAF9D|nr:ABC transporter permease [Streptomyces sp. NBC_01239]MCX4816066.1 ABC transporter permease [Streptomyces sp. NBC_01239]